MGFKAGEKIYRLISVQDTVAKLRVARLEANYSMEDAGKLVGLHQAQVSRIESGVQEFFTESIRERVEKLAKHLNVKGLKFVEGTWRNTKRKVPVTRHSGVDEINDVIAATVPVPATQPPQPALPVMSQIASVLHVYKLGALDAQKALDTIHSIVQVA